MKAGVEWYEHAGRLVRLVKPHTNSKGIHRPDGGLIILPVDIDHAIDVMSRHCDFLKYDGRLREFKRIDCPPKLAKILLSRAGSWQFNSLSGTVLAPSPREDGSIFDSPGYDKKSGLYLAKDNPTDYKRPVKKSKKSAAETLDIFYDLLGEFAFQTPDDFSACVCAIISSLWRRSLDAAPLIAINASTPGTGKSYLADTIAIIATGRRSPVIGLGEDKAEAEKRLSGALMMGDQLITIDNVVVPLAGDLFCQMISQSTLALRPLGSSQILKIPTNCTLIANGNNIVVLGDMRRRVMLIRLDANSERPEQRRFDRDVLSYAAEHRGKIISASLTLSLAYAAAGFPEVDLPPYGGFAEWDKWCRRPLAWIGLPDPLKASEVFREVDPDLATQRQLYAAWHDLHGNASLTAAALIDSANQTMRDALNSVCADHISPRRLAGWLRRHKGRIVDGLRLDSEMDSHSKVQLWRLVTCG